MFTKTAAFYDAIYAARGKDYLAEAQWIRAGVEREHPGRRLALLDVACGTGLHLAALRGHFDVAGLDADPAMITIARERLPGVPLHVARMQDFTLPDRFDVIVSLFSSIGYVADEDELRATVGNVARHLRPGGTFILEPWLHPEDYRPGLGSATFVDRSDLKLARMNVGERYGNTSVLRFEYMVGENGEISRFSETHRLQLFSDATYRRALDDAGFDVHAERSDLFNRGLYFATKG